MYISYFRTSLRSNIHCNVIPENAIAAIIQLAYPYMVGINYHPMVPIQCTDAVAWLILRIISYYGNCQKKLEKAVLPNRTFFHLLLNRYGWRPNTCSGMKSCRVNMPTTGALLEVFGRTKRCLNPTSRKSIRALAKDMVSTTV